MTHLRYSFPKTGRHFLLEVLLEAGSEGVFRLENKRPAAPPGHLRLEGELWNAGQLLLAAVAAGWGDCFLAYARREGFRFAGISISVIGQLQPVKGAYKFTGMDVYPEIRLADNQDQRLATRLLKKAEQQNPVAGTLDTALYYHSRILPPEANPSADSSANQ